MLEPVEGEENRYTIMEEGKQPTGDMVDFGALVCKDDEIPLTLKDDMIGVARNFERRDDYRLSVEIRVLHDDLIHNLPLSYYDAAFYIAPFQHDIRRDEKTGKAVRILTYGRIRSVALLGPNPGFPKAFMP